MNLGSAEYNMLFSPERKEYSENKAENINPKNDNNALAFIVNSVTENSTVLDVGCAYGYVGEWLVKNKNCTVYGLDIDAESIEYVKKGGFYKGLFNIDLDYPENDKLKTELDKFNSLAEGLFDFIICADVLEHLKDPASALEIIASKLKFSGEIVVSIPNIAHLDIILNLLEGRFNYSDFGLLDNTHLRFFTKSSFIEFINSANEKFIKSGFKFDLRIFGETRYSSEFLDYIGTKYPKTHDFFINLNKDLLILQNIIILNKVNINANTFELKRLIFEKNSFINKIENNLTERESAIAELSEKQNLIAELIEKNRILKESLSRTSDERNAYLNGLNEINKSDFWKLALFYYKLRDNSILKYPFKFLKRIKRKDLKLRNPLGFKNKISDKNLKFLKKLSKDNGGTYKNLKTWYSEKEPIVSIIILNYNKSAFTVQCVKEVWKHTKGIKYEVIVVDNGSEPNDKKHLNEIKKLLDSSPDYKSYCNIIELSKNRFFGEGNNIGSEAAKGKYLLFLNNDAFVTEDWLMPLVSALDDNDTAAAGPKFLYPDGKLQEAGAFIKPDGAALQRGKLDDPDKPEYNEQNEVDYCSAACLIVKRELFEDVLGFDLCWEPAYYEDVDLCFKFKLLNKKTIYVPSSKIVHMENLTSSDKNYPLKLNNIVEINRDKFVRKYKEIINYK